MDAAGLTAPRPLTTLYGRGRAVLRNFPRFRVAPAAIFSFGVFSVRTHLDAPIGSLEVLRAGRGRRASCARRRAEISQCLEKNGTRYFAGYVEISLMLENGLDVVDTGCPARSRDLICPFHDSRRQVRHIEAFPATVAIIGIRRRRGRF
jgi:hypothetical protein